MVDIYKSKLKSGQLGKKDPKTGIPVTLERGMYRDEIRTVVDAPYHTLPDVPTVKKLSRARRDRLLMIMLWETWARENELLMTDVEDLDIKNRTVLLRHTKAKPRRNKDGSTRSEIIERMVSYSKDTQLKIIEYLETRRSGPLFMSSRGSRIGVRNVRWMINKYAVASGIQKIIGYDKTGDPRYLVVPKAFREAGEAYSVMDGMDREMAARIAGHTVEVQKRNYTKFDSIRARELADKHRKL